MPSDETRSRPRHGAPPESQRVHQHHPRSAGRRFRAERDFPADDSGDGFDNIGDVLTISPVLMEKLPRRRRADRGPRHRRRPAAQAARGRVLARKDKRSAASISAPSKPTHRIEFDGEYTVRFGLPGERAPDAQAGDAGLLDGRQAAAHHAGRDQALQAGLLRSLLGRGDAPRTCPKAITCSAPASSTTISSRRLPRKDAYDRKKNKFLDSITFVGPFPSKTEKASRKKIFICDPNSGRRLRREDRLQSGAPCLPPSGDQGRSRGAAASSWPWRRPTGNPPSRAFNWRIQAMLVSPHFLFRIERDPNPRDPTKVHPVSRSRAGLAPELLPVELDARRRTARRSPRPASCATPASLDAQVKRMLADPRSAALADNFAGQWLETAQPRCRQARSAEVPRMESRTARRHEDRDAAVLRPRPAREPPALASSSTRATRS